MNYVNSSFIFNNYLMANLVLSIPTHSPPLFLFVLNQISDVMSFHKYLVFISKTYRFFKNIIILKVTVTLSSLMSGVYSWIACKHLQFFSCQKLWLKNNSQHTPLPIVYSTSDFMILRIRCHIMAISITSHTVQVGIEEPFKERKNSSSCS